MLQYMYSIEILKSTHEIAMEAIRSRPSPSRDLASLGVSRVTTSSACSYACMYHKIGNGRQRSRFCTTGQYPLGLDVHHSISLQIKLLNVRNNINFKILAKKKLKVKN